MKKIINKVEDVVSESLEGFIMSNNRTHKKVDSINGVTIKDLNKNKVNIVVGGGSGHEPVFLGLVGDGMADGAAIGDVFASPDPHTILEVIKAVNSDEGVLCLVINYAGDTMNFEMAANLAATKGIKVDAALITDDIASAPKGEEEKRRGVAGLLLITKVVGAATKEGYNLAETKEVVVKANDRTRTISIALSPCSLPGSYPNFSIKDNEYEFGMGIHGEPGIETRRMEEADNITRLMMSELLKDLELKQNDEVIVLINGTGSTTYLEMNIVYRQVFTILQKQDITVYDSIIGPYCTSLEMGGVSISILKLDNELKKLFNISAYTPYYYKK